MDEPDVTLENLKLPKAFVFYRLHSFLGLWLVVYLCYHLLINSQAALFFLDEGYGFVSAVNRLESMPYIKVIEIVILGLPFLFHGSFGIYYLFTAKLNAHRTDGTKPALPQYRRNRAFSWQRITSWILLFGILGHVVQMRFIAYPASFSEVDSQVYMMRLSQDKGLTQVAEKLHVKLYENPLQEESMGQQWIETAKKKPLKTGEILAVSPMAGAAFYLMVRETFKSPLMVILYTIFVVAATFHAFNGLWTAMITWGITLSRLAQKRMRTLCNLLMVVVTFLGLMAIWGTYWTFQFQG